MLMLKGYVHDETLCRKVNIAFVQAAYDVIGSALKIVILKEEILILCQHS